MISARGKPLVLLAGETGFISLLKYIAENNGYSCVLADDLNGAPALAAAERPDLIALDAVQARGWIHGICDVFYRNPITRPIPILIMTTGVVHPSEISPRIGDLSVILKPFSSEAFVDRLHDLLRQGSAPTNTNVLRVGDIIMELEAHRVYRGQRSVSLAPIEYRILRQLLQHPRKVLSRDRILATVRDEPDATLRSIDVHISRIRKALCGQGEPNHIRTIRGIGYSVDAAPDNLGALASRSHACRAGG